MRNPLAALSGPREACNSERRGGDGSARRKTPASAWSGGSRGYCPSKLAKNDRANRAGAHRGVLRVGDAVRRGRRRGSTVEADGARGDVARRCLGASGPDGRTRQASVMLVDGSAWPERHWRQRNRRRSAPLLVGRWRRYCAVQGKADSGGEEEGKASRGQLKAGTGDHGAQSRREIPCRCAGDFGRGRCASGIRRKGTGLTSGPGLAEAQRRAGDARERWQVGPAGRGDNALAG